MGVGCGPKLFQSVLRFQRLLNLAASAGIRRSLARFAADADYDRSSAHDSGGPAVFGQFTQDVASIPAMRSSLYVVSLGRIHYFYLRHSADPKRTSSRLRSGVVFSSRKRRVSDHGPARQRRDRSLKCNSYLLPRSVSMTCFRFFYTARAPGPELDRRTVAQPSFRINTVSTICWLATPSLMGTD